MRIIRGKYGRRRFSVPGNITARPTTDFARENIFNVLENLIDFEESPTALDLFAGTGAVGWEFVSRGCSKVVAVENSHIQNNFIKKVKSELADDTMEIIKGDVFRFLLMAKESFDIVFADPPYDLKNFDEVPVAVFSSKVLKPGSLFVLEHSGTKDYSSLPGFLERRTYGSVNFSIFRIPVE